MKRCPKCDLEYPDTDNFCIECGKKLKGVEPAPPREISDQGPRIEKLESRIQELRPTDIKPLESRIKKLEKALGKEVKEVRDKVKKFPTDELMTLLSQVGALERTVEDLKDRIETVRHPELPEDITEIAKNVKRIKQLQVLIKGLKNTDKKIAERIAGVAGNIGKTRSSLEKHLGETRSMREQVKKVAKTSAENTRLTGVVISNIEKRVDSRIAAMEQRFKGLTEVQRKIELMKIDPTKLRDDIKKEVMQDILRELKEVVS